MLSRPNKQHGKGGIPCPLYTPLGHADARCHAPTTRCVLVMPTPQNTQPAAWCNALKHIDRQTTNANTCITHNKAYKMHALSHTHLPICTVSLDTHMCQHMAYLHTTVLNAWDVCLGVGAWLPPWWPPTVDNTQSYHHKRWHTWLPNTGVHVMIHLMHTPTPCTTTIPKHRTDAGTYTIHVQHVHATRHLDIRND